MMPEEVPAGPTFCRAAAALLARRWKALAIVLLTGAGLAPGLPLSAQQPLPDSFTNLKVLPKNITREQLLGTMRAFTGALGVRCDYCHAEGTGTSGAGPAQSAPRAPGAAPAQSAPRAPGPAPAQSPPRLNFASDAKAQKRIARGMLQMVQGINGEYLAKIADLDEPRVQVRCVTCHHGAAVPRTLTDVLSEDVSEKGVPAAMQHYSQLKAEYYGSGAYDFREASLDELARQLTGGGKPDDALAVLDFALQEFPQSGTVPFLQGEVLLQKGDKAGAIAKYRRALELQPQNAAARRRLTELGQS